MVLIYIWFWYAMNKFSNNSSHITWLWTRQIMLPQKSVVYFASQKTFSLAGLVTSSVSSSNQSEEFQHNSVTHFFNKTSRKTFYYKVLIDSLKTSTFNIKWLILFKLTFLYILKTSNFQFCPHVRIYIMKCSHYKIKI